jgi:hypothetical protein
MVLKLIPIPFAPNNSLFFLVISLASFGEFKSLRFEKDV